MRVSLSFCACAVVTVLGGAFQAQALAQAQAQAQIKPQIKAQFHPRGPDQSTFLQASLLNASLPDSPDHELKARGLVRSSGRVEFRTDLVAPVLNAPFLEGMAFNEGDILIDFDCKHHRAELKVAQARANSAWLDHKSKKRLLAHRAIGRDEVAMAAAAAAEASAEVNVHKTKGESCQFKAPFAGRMVELNAHPNELPSNDKPLLVIIKDSVLELEMVVPSFWLTWMEKGQGFQFKIDETGETLGARIERIGAEVDPVSQTVKIIGLLNTKGTRTLSGMSGNAWFDKEELEKDRLVKDKSATDKSRADKSGAVSQ